MTIFSINPTAMNQQEKMLLNGLHCKRQVKDTSVKQSILFRLEVIKQLTDGFCLLTDKSKVEELMERMTTENYQKVLF